MPTKNFFLPLLLVPTCSSCYPFLYTTCKRPLSSYVTSMSLNCNHGQMTGMLLNCASLNPELMTCMLLNCTVPFSDPLSSMSLNCTFSIPVSWITCSLKPPHHLSHIAFIEDTDNMQHKVMCPALQMYPHDRSHRGPDVPMACAPACYANDSLESDSVEYYPYSAPLSHYPLITSYTSQTTLDRHSSDLLDFPLDAFDGHGSLSEIPS
jgi:hypothetical protein